ncbi:hypothetical protein LCGC14_0811010 [marine sediment metagenome]|uniref:Uncharacterized protein n=1 Tax=marine sediment metagenome TaxID=412755 RepID=A0A0F9PLR6_9ZZZZ
MKIHIRELRTPRPGESASGSKTKRRYPHSGDMIVIFQLDGADHLHKFLLCKGFHSEDFMEMLDAVQGYGSCCDGSFHHTLLRIRE